MGSSVLTATFVVAILLPSVIAYQPTPPPQSRVEKRRPWDVLRFVQQSSRFVSLPNLLRRPDQARTIQSGDVIWSAGSKSNVFRFAPLDDVVMGGASSSSVDENTGLWRGTVSSANSGGFVGIRSMPFENGRPLDMTSCRGIELRLRGGDGRRFKAVVRDSVDFNGVCWTTSFDAPRVRTLLSLGEKDNKGKGVGIMKLPFNKQTPTIFAKTVPGVTFTAENVLGIQLTYSKVSACLHEDNIALFLRRKSLLKKFKKVLVCHHYIVCRC